MIKLRRTDGTKYVARLRGMRIAYEVLIEGLEETRPEDHVEREENIRMDFNEI
jgi:hypothetical protein